MHRGISTDGSGFGVGRLLDTEISGRLLADRVGADSPSRLCPTTSAACGTGGPVPTIDTAHAPSDARQVGDFKPELLLTREHHLCPGCGEPIAMRSLSKTIAELGVDRPHRRRLRHRLLHRVLENLDVEVVQALHGRALRSRRE